MVTLAHTTWPSTASDWPPSQGARRLRCQNPSCPPETASYSACQEASWSSTANTCWTTPPPPLRLDRLGRMRSRRAVTAVCQHKPLDLTSEPAPSPTGRPYSPYPYRDLPPTPREWERHAQPSPTPAPEIHHDRCSLFPSLPIELRLQIWRQAILSASEYGRVHRIRLAVSESLDHKESRLELVATPRLADSTRATRSLLSTCAESRRESLSHPFSTLPDALPLQHGGLLRCDLSKDIILLEELSPSLLLQLNHLHLHHCHDNHPHPNLHPLSNTRHLGLDLTPLLSQTPTRASSYPPAAAAPIPADIESPLVTFAASLPRLEQIYLLQAPAGVPSSLSPSPSASRPRPPAAARPEHLFLNSDFADTTATAAGVAGEWYATRPPLSFLVDAAAGAGGYYAHLTRLVRCLCQLRQALDVLATVGADDSVDGAGGGLSLSLSFERLAGVRVRLLGHYIMCSESGVKGVGGEMNGEGQRKIWEEASPERCLEVALGGEPRWVQWEWVCQCLDC